MATRPFPETRFLRERAHALCMGLFLRLDEFVDEFPTGTPRKLITLVQDVLKLLQDVAEKEEDPGILGWICRVLDQSEPVPGLIKSLDWLDNAHTAQTPRGLVQFLESATKQLGSSSEYLVAPDYEVNYSITPFVSLWRELLGEFLPDTELNKVFAQLPDCELVRFPRIYRENVLNHAILGHELGHPIAADFIDQYETSKKYQRKVKSVIAKIKKELRYSGVAPLDLAQKQREQFEMVYTLFYRAQEELISDAIAVYTFGPSAVFAFYDLFCTDLLDVPPSKSSYYPPNRYRLRLMYSHLREQGHAAVLDRKMQSRAYRKVGNSVRKMLRHLKDIGATRADLVELRRDPYIKIAYDWVADTLPEAFGYAKRRARTFTYRSADAQREVPALLDLLSIGVPPGERGRWPMPDQVDWRSSLLAAWCMRIYLVSSNRSRGASLEKTLRELSDLAMKGIEYAILRGEYQEAYPKALI